MRQALLQSNEWARKDELRGGSTVVLVAACGGNLWCCCAGDSRVVAGLRNGGVIRMSVDHVTTAQDEVARLQAAGGRLDWGRIGGRLPMTRGMGNFDLEADGFICLPHLSSLPCSEVDFVIIASDGLWDVIDDHASCSIVRNIGLADASAAAEQLADCARKRGSNDDIAAIVAYFHPEDFRPSAHQAWALGA